MVENLEDLEELGLVVGQVAPLDDMLTSVGLKKIVTDENNEIKGNLQRYSTDYTDNEDAIANLGSAYIDNKRTLDGTTRLLKYANEISNHYENVAIDEADDQKKNELNFADYLAKNDKIRDQYIAPLKEQLIADASMTPEELNNLIAETVEKGPDPNIREYQLGPDKWGRWIDKEGNVLTHTQVEETKLEDRILVDSNNPSAGYNVDIDDNFVDRPFTGTPVRYEFGADPSGTYGRGEQEGWYPIQDPKSGPGPINDIIKAIHNENILNSIESLRNNFSEG